MSDPAAGRFFTIQLVRVAGVALTVYALLVFRARAPWPDALPVWAAALVLIGGLFAAFIAPHILARKWRSGGS